MADSWKLTAFGSKPVVQAALLAQEDVEDWPWDVTLTGFEIADDRPDDWRLDAYFARRPDCGRPAHGRRAVRRHRAPS